MSDNDTGLKPSAISRISIFALLALAAGILCGRFLPGVWQLVGILPSVLVSALLYCKFKERGLFALPVFSLLGLIVTLLAVRTPNAELSRLIKTGEAAEIEAVVLDASQTSIGGTRTVLLARRISFADGKEFSGCRIICYFDSAPELSPGQVIILSGELTELSGARNPGALDEWQYYRARGISYKLFAKNYILTDKHDSSAAFLPSVRQRLAASFDKSLPGELSGTMKALIIGDITGLDPETAELFRGAGIYHILSISGQHITITFLLISWLCGKLFKKQAALIISLVLLSSYCIITGASVSTVRAGLMSAAIIFGRLGSRQVDSASSTAAAGIIILLFQPLFLFDPGFLYSFLAVFGMIFGIPAFEHAARRFKLAQKSKLLSDGLAATVCAFAATTPVTLFFYGALYPYSILTNLIILPLVPPLLILGFLICLLGLIAASPILSAFAAATALILDLIELASRAVTALPFSTIYPGSPHIAIILLMYAAMCLFAASGISERPKLKLALYCILAVFPLLTLIPQPLKVDMLDIGQGDCTVIRRGEDCIVIDGGKTSGGKTLLSYLRYSGIYDIDALFVSHFDSDHAGGLLPILSDFNVRRIFIPNTADSEESSLEENFLETAKKRGIPVTPISAGNEIRLGELAMKCLFPPAGSTLSSNDASIVLRMDYRKTSFMFTGDSGFDAEREIMSMYPASLLDIDVLKVAHHGSRYSSAEEYLALLTPKLAVISAGRGNSYGHPTQETLNRLELAGAASYCTADYGALLLSTYGNEVNINTMLK